MDRAVADASATLAWFFDEAASRDELQSLYKTYQLVAPGLWRLEMANALLVRLRRKLLTSAEVHQGFSMLERLEIELIEEISFISFSRLAQIAIPNQLTSYDTLYLDLAVRLGLPLISLDKNLRAAAKRAGVKLLPVSI
jgi:predicted nucleic acid-binding protein